MEEQNVQLVESIYDGFANRDPGALGALADDIEWYEAEGLPWGGLQCSPAAVAENIFSPALELVTDRIVTPEQVLASGDTVAIVQRYSGTATSGKALDLVGVGVGVWNVRDGKVIRYRQFVDTAKFVEVVSAEVAAGA